MMKIKEIQAKSIITKTNLPDGDFVINPYIGCVHKCKYCYARFMKRFTGHEEEWGDFCDVKINAPDLIPTDTEKYGGKSITIGSVTDPYNPLEKKYELTRKILKKLIPLKPRLDILTKSDLVVRDIDLIKQFKNSIVAISLLTLDENVQKKLELALSPTKRIDALKKLHEEGVKTALFISPIFPFITDWKEMIKKTKNFVDEYWFENLNLYPSIKGNIYEFLKKFNPELIGKYKEIYSGDNYWKKVEKEIENFCKEEGVEYKIYFHHKEIRKK